MSYPGPKNRRGGDEWRNSKKREYHGDHYSPQKAETSTAPDHSGANSGYGQGRGAPPSHPTPHHSSSAGVQTPTGPRAHTLYRSESAGNQIPTGPRAHTPASLRSDTPTGLSSQGHKPEQSNYPSFGGAQSTRQNKRGGDDSVKPPSAKRVNDRDHDGRFNKPAMLAPPRPDMNTSIGSAQGQKHTQNSGKELLPRQDNPRPVKNSRVGLLGTLLPLENPAQVNSTIDHHLNRALAVANSLYKSHFDKEADRRKKVLKQVWKADPNGIRGQFAVVPITVTRGDPSDPPRGNHNIRPAPQHSLTQEKLCLAVLIKNDPQSHSSVYQILTTFSHSDIDNNDQLRRNIKANYVNIHRTGYDDHMQSWLSFRSINFTSTNSNYEFDSPCFMDMEGQMVVSKRTEFLKVGHLTGPRDFEILDEVLQEAFFRTAPNLRPSTRDQGTVSSTSANSSAPLMREAPNAPPTSPTLPPPQSRELHQQASQAEDTVASQVISLVFHIEHLLTTFAVTPVPQ
jgi:hypothetical protein